MKPLGLDEGIYRRYFTEIREIMDLPVEQQDAALGARAYAIATADVTEEYRKDWGEIFAAIKRTQFAEQAGTIDVF